MLGTFDRQSKLSERIEKTHRGVRTDIELRVISQCGERWVSDRSFPFFCREGTVERVVGIAEDMTNPKRAEEELQRANQRLILATRAGAVGLA